MEARRAKALGECGMHARRGCMRAKDAHAWCSDRWETDVGA